MKTAVLSRGFGGNSPVQTKKKDPKENKEKKEKKQEEKREKKQEEKKEEPQKNPPPPPPNINIKPPPPINILGNLPTTKIAAPPPKQLAYDQQKFDKAITELKRKLDQQKEAENFEECIKTKGKIKVFFF